MSANLLANGPLLILVTLMNHENAAINDLKITNLPLSYTKVEVEFGNFPIIVRPNLKFCITRAELLLHIV